MYCRVGRDCRYSEARRIGHWGLLVRFGDCYGASGVSGVYWGLAGTVGTLGPEGD